MKGNEHFIMARTQEDADNIAGMNDTRAKVIQQKIRTMTQAQGVANEYDIQEIRQEAKIIQKGGVRR